MTRLENIAIETLCYNKEIRELANEFSLKTVKDLHDLLLNNPSLSTPTINEKLVNLKIAMGRSNRRKDKEPVIYLTDTYQDSTLNYTDTLNKGNVLLLASPTQDALIRYWHVDRMPIDVIKRWLALTEPNGDNYFLRNVRNVDKGSILRLVDAINMYSEQVVRQSKLDKMRDENVFTFQQNNKKKIVENEYANMITYLVNNTQEFVWGKLSAFQKQLYVSSIIGSNKLDFIIRDRMVNIIANYMTFEELKKVSSEYYEESQKDYGALHRLIKK